MHVKNLSKPEKQNYLKAISSYSWVDLEQANSYHILSIDLKVDFFESRKEFQGDKIIKTIE